MASSANTDGWARRPEVFVVAVVVVGAVNKDEFVVRVVDDGVRQMHGVVAKQGSPNSRRIGDH